MDESSPVRAAALREICSKTLLASASQAPVDSATRGRKRTPCWAHRSAVFKWEAFVAA